MSGVWIPIEPTVSTPLVNEVHKQAPAEQAIELIKNTYWFIIQTNKV